MSERHMNNAGKYVVIGEGKYLLLQVLLALHAFVDARCLVICAPRTRFLRRSTLTSDYLETDFGEADDDAIVERIHRFAGNTVDVTVIPADCVATRWVQRLRHRLAVSVIPMPEPAMLDCFDNKWRFYQFCMENGLRAPLTRYAADKLHLHFSECAATLGVPFVVKPVGEQASAGNHVIADDAGFRSLILDNDAYRYAPLIAQRYIEGKDVGINLMAVNGALEALAIQRRVDPSHDGSRVEFFGDTRLEQVAAIVAGRSRYTGVMNIDVRIEDATGIPYLLESNPRFWRSLSASVWCGLNFVGLSVMRASRRSGGNVARLNSGSADTYYHPLFRPALWRYALDQTHRGKLIRTMMPEICTLAMSARILAARAKVRMANPQRAPIHAVGVE